MWQPKTDKKNENCLAENGTVGMYKGRDGEHCYRNAVMKTPVRHRKKFNGFHHAESVCCKISVKSLQILSSAFDPIITIFFSCCFCKNSAEEVA